MLDKQCSVFSLLDSIRAAAVCLKKLVFGVIEVKKVQGYFEQFSSLSQVI